MTGRPPTIRLAMKLAAILLVLLIVVWFQPSEQITIIAFIAMLIMAGEATANDLLPWLNEEDDEHGP